MRRCFTLELCAALSTSWRSLARSLARLLTPSLAHSLEHIDASFAESVNLTNFKKLRLFSLTKVGAVAQTLSKCILCLQKNLTDDGAGGQVMYSVDA